jgi:hypothetical protein
MNQQTFNEEAAAGTIFSAATETKDERAFFFRA